MVTTVIAPVTRLAPPARQALRPGPPGTGRPARLTLL
jgi:hypothetical protein